MGIQVRRKPVVLLMTAAPTGPVSLTAAARGGPRKVCGGLATREPPPWPSASEGKDSDSLAPSSDPPLI